MSNVRKRGALRRLCDLIVNLSLVAAVGASLAFLAPSLLGYERYVITGGSMSGTIEKGSVVFERPVPVEDLEVGDVITYLPPPDSGVSTLVTHRIISITPGEDGNPVLVTQGDANADPDPWKFSLLDSEQPVVSHTVPRVGHLIIALADTDVRRLVIGVPAGLVALLALIELMQALRPLSRRVPNRGGTVELLGDSGADEVTSVDDDERAPALAHT